MTDIQAATESIVAATSHPVSVQLINQGAGIWGNVATGLITGLLTGGITLTGIWLTHYFTLKRERQASEDKMKKELHYIATELVFMLERYAEGCFRVVTDDGQDDDAPQPERKAVTNYPELPVLQDEAHRAIAYAAEYSDPPWHKDYFRERQYQFTRLGINAVILAVRLRKATGMPETRLTGHDEWSAVSVFRKVWRRERALRAAEATRNREWNQLVIPDGMSNQ
ncbi:hypothetical protein BK367_22305 [Escherichia coli]|uniref:hypothetical protein n=1 Tax=Escherichia coli TaxID=562 RepID=UPI0009291E87|nr:hypothetical protein [Escherichia coli]HDU4526895.1 hypothetical protein [Klebsiella pneumoniae]EKS5469504.1 hypothetical protein [Escherichia coli]MBW4300021.1 hypothetical protein [Escherichia coli]MCD9326589.1 hypothetical protein [Escherichia coli]MCH4716221.1 hypothetical protein [Escherichia coli]